MAIYPRQLTSVMCMEKVLKDIENCGNKHSELCMSESNNNVVIDKFASEKKRASTRRRIVIQMCSICNHDFNICSCSRQCVGCEKPAALCSCYGSLCCEYCFKSSEDCRCSCISCEECLYPENMCECLTRMYNPEICVERKSKATDYRIRRFTKSCRCDYSYCRCDDIHHACGKPSKICRCTIWARDSDCWGSCKYRTSLFDKWTCKYCKSVSTCDPNYTACTYHCNCYDICRYCNDIYALCTCSSNKISDIEESILVAVKSKKSFNISALDIPTELLSSHFVLMLPVVGMMKQKDCFVSKELIKKYLCSLIMFRELTAAQPWMFTLVMSFLD
jgi:hypothetical protein